MAQGLPDKAIQKIGMLIWDSDLKRWRKLSFDVDVNGAIVVSSYAANPLYVRKVDGSDVLSAAPLNGQAKIAVTSTAVQLGSNIILNGVILTAKSSNAAPILVGGSGVTNTIDGTGNGYILEPGASAPWAVTNTNVLYINGTSGDIVSFAGS